MKIIVNRIAPRKGYTIGKLYINGEYECDTLEDEVRELSCASDKIAGETAIPNGTYKVSYTYSPRFQKYLPLIENVPYFSGIRIHSGNTAADTEGCILVGYNTEKGKVLNSRKAFSIIEPLIKEACNSGEEVTIKIQ